mgnify:CR=1 FL=1
MKLKNILEGNIGASSFLNSNFQKIGINFFNGGYLKKSEPFLLTGLAGGIPPEPPFRPRLPKAEGTVSNFLRALARKENHN